MRTVYACVLDVSVRSPETSVQGFERLWSLATQWVEGIYKTRWQQTLKIAPVQPRSSPINLHSLQTQREQSAGGICVLASLEWSFPDDEDRGLHWLHYLQFARNGPKIEASVAIRIVSRHAIAKPLSYTLRRPDIVDQIVQNFQCSIGRSTIPLKHRELGRDEVEPFVDDTLCSPDRWLPVVVISPDQGMRDYRVDPAELQQTLLGHAQVIALRDVSAGREWTETLGNKELSCYLGAVRLYWPGFNKRAKPTDHPLYLADSIRFHAENQQPLGPHLFRTLVAVSGFRFSNPPVAQLVRSAIEGEKHLLFQSMLENSKALEDAGHIMKELERAWDEIKQLKQERDEARNQASELARELEMQKAAWTEVHRGPRQPVVAPPPPRGPIASVLDAIERARTDFPHTLLVLPDAIESARQSPYRSPERIYSLFQVLDELTHKWREVGSIGSGWHPALKPKGFEYAEFISPTAKGKFGHEYTFNYEGRQVMCEHHVTIGAHSADTCISVHWFRDEAKKRLVIGWCGRHLSNTQS